MLWLVVMLLDQRALILKLLKEAMQAQQAWARADPVT
jgi:hypothetical protein